MSDLHIICSGGVEVSGLSPIYRKTTPTAIVCAGGIQVGGASVVGFLKPGVLSIISSGGAVVGGESVIAFITPAILEVVTSGGVKVGGQSIVSFPQIIAHVLSGGVQVGGQSLVEVTFPVAPKVLSVVTSGGVVVSGASVVIHIIPPVLSIICSGGVQVGAFRVPELTVVEFIYPADLILAAIIGAGGVEVGGQSVVTWSRPPVYAVPIPQAVTDADVFVGGASIIAFIHPQILEVIIQGGVTIGGEAVDDGVFETYVLTGARGEPSIYSGFNFNSYAKYRGQYYGAGEDGIYLLEGEDDAGSEIHPGIKIGPVNFGTDREKRLRLLRCGGSTTGAQVKVSNGNGSAGYYEVENGRAAVSRKVQGRELTIEIADFETLDHLEIVPLILQKR